ncbi:MAG: NAD(P)H-dependent oxidoreductase [Blastocatellia bacterium]|nr:NAD(P)H-dependent oxidoreductase [Blastocatellia bacterium]
MNILIVYAHQEPQSFNGALKDLAVSLLRENGHAVQVSDLYAMKFKAVADQEDFRKLQNPEFFKLGAEQRHAQEHGLYARDIQQEHEKLRWADFVLFQFPLYWFSMPAILKGWVDRVMGVGFAYGGDMWFEKGGLKGKKAMLSLTTGGGPAILSERGRSGSIEVMLWPLQNGILRFCGFDVLPPFLAWGPAGATLETRQEYLEQFKERLLAIPTTEPLFFHPEEDYDSDHVLKPEVAAQTLIQQFNPVRKQS